MTLTLAAPDQARKSRTTAPLPTAAKPPFELIHAAIRAANTQNTQPWRFEVLADEIVVFADLERRAGSFDPFLREMHQSLGCAVENIVQAAAAHGFRADVEAFPGKLPRAVDGPAARIVFTPASSRVTALYDAIPQRRTHRGPFHRGRRLPPNLVREMRALADGGLARLTVFDISQQQRMGQLIVASTRAILDDEEMLRDKAVWLRLLTEDAGRAQDGLTVEMTAAGPLDAMSRKLVTPSINGMHRIWLRDTAEVHVRTAALMGAILVRDPYDRASAIEVGRLWQRVHLWLTARKLAAQPLNQPIERVDRERQLRQPVRTADALSRITCDPTWRPAFIFRAGYPVRAAAASVRRPVRDVAVEAVPA